MNQKTSFKQFEILEDPRDIKGKKHKLIDIIIMSIYGTLCGFLELNKDYFINLLNLENGIPSHDTFSRVLASIDSKKFMELFIE